MPAVTYKTHTFPQQRRLVPNLMRAIVNILADAQRPMSDIELASILGNHYRRRDLDFFRQIQLNLRDGVDYGILRRQRNRFSLRSRRLSELMSTLGSSIRR
ncbi:uncharacterized protein LOC108149918 isoform X2 [Drosophila elegans]|uniref:uncharacterized protein LOC108149918 isoform X2 n=2 Tax=Drosophila elegans TaxID=30023 RepID=UPI0007E5FC53|nr:uncharacterized protein LOC108149918 isoform X2 [Drosophila elegans]